MKFVQPCFVLVLVLDFAKVIVCYGARGPFYSVEVMFKRFGTECVLDAGVKGKRGEIVREILSVDNTIRTCLTRLTDLYREKPNFKDDNENRSTKEIEFACERFNEVANCFKPLQILFRKCNHLEALAVMAFVRKVCQNKGSRIIEFQKANGKRCFNVDDRRGPEAFSKCIQREYGAKFNESSVDYFGKNVCKATKELKTCVDESMGNCKNVRPKIIFETFFIELINESSDAKKCFDRVTSKSAETTTTKNPRQIQPKKKKHSRPAYSW